MNNLTDSSGYELSGLLYLSFIAPQARRRQHKQKNLTVCGQDSKIKVFPESHRERVHQEEDSRGVQHASDANRGGSGTVWNSGSQHSPAPYRQDLVLLCSLSFITMKQCSSKVGALFLHFGASSGTVSSCLPG